MRVRMKHLATISYILVIVSFLTSMVLLLSERIVFGFILLAAEIGFFILGRFFERGSLKEEMLC